MSFLFFFCKGNCSLFSDVLHIYSQVEVTQTPTHYYALCCLQGIYQKIYFNVNGNAGQYLDYIRDIHKGKYGSWIWKYKLFVPVFITK